jgi:NitT/TauT family transport system substrate-binding protein
MANNNLDNKQEETGTKAKEFTAPTAEMETVQAISNKKVSINFPTAGYTLDNEARTIIDREFVDIAQQFSNARIRVEGNTDNTGNYDSNVALSKKRAQAVVDYLVKEYGMNKNRFIVVGNGPKQAVKDGVLGDNENYRRTDFNLISD